jgi:triphosphoribosyl-dephospho-CoA synthase
MIAGLGRSRANTPQLGTTQVKLTRAEWIAKQATEALCDEVRLTPKPGLVDGRGSGAHHDATLAMFVQSAKALGPYFAEMASAARDKQPGLLLRETLGAIGRRAEEAMLQVTGGVNTHRGAIWSMGLLVAAASAAPRRAPADWLCDWAADVAVLTDRHAPASDSHGIGAMHRFGVRGARGEAMEGFPHVCDFGLKTLHQQRARGVAETFARLDALLSIMSSLYDTCLLHRGGEAALRTAQAGAMAVLESRGTSTPEGWRALAALDAALIGAWASPGGSADLLAATLFVDRISAEGTHA